MTQLDDKAVPDIAMTERHTRLKHFLHKPINLFVNREVAGGLIMITAAVAALFWANSPWSASYHTFWETDIELAIGNWQLHHLTFEEFVNEALMVIFFFVVGLEIKRELVTGDLRHFRAAAVPAIGALGGMVVPAAIYFALNASGDASNGWGIPIATDIAFAVGIVALLGSRVNPVLKLFLLTLAIVDDIGAIIVIAVFYSDSLSFGWILIAASAFVLIRLARAAHVWSTPFYVVIGIVAWYATLESGIHATIAGVILGLMTPAKPEVTMEHATEAAVSLDKNSTPDNVSMTAFLMNEARPQTEILEHQLHPVSAYLVIPLFALANAGIDITGESLGDAAASSVAWGVFLGLVVGKPLGIVAAAWIATRFGLALPKGVHWPEFIGMGMAAGIGFTVSIFVTNLAFGNDSAFTETAKIGVLFASVSASILALLLLTFSNRLRMMGQAMRDRKNPGGASDDDVAADAAPTMNDSDGSAGAAAAAPATPTMEGSADPDPA